LSTGLLAWTPWDIAVRLIRVAARVKYKYVVGLVSQVGATSSFPVSLSPPCYISPSAIELCIIRQHDGEDSA
jgi:hypothetical protein